VKAAALAPASRYPVGVVGLGLMGRSIITCLLAAGHPVTAVTRSLARHKDTRKQILALLREMKGEGLLKQDPKAVIERLTVSEKFEELKGAELVVESIIENFETKKQAIAQLEAVLPAKAIIGSNTSAIPVSLLQEGTKRPERILGIHWAEPAHITRFLEIICGERSRLANAQKVAALATRWGKEPTLVRKDIRGFITNRIMYAMLREAFYLVENGYATPEDVDRSVRNDMGWWITLAGPFRFMDLTGIPAYRAVMQDLLPELASGSEVPELMKKVVDSGALGVANAKGFYKYSEEEAKRWEKRFLEFTYDIRRLARKYPESSK
jgi:3-hydroxybutyryl-CoA dehydrogenase